MPITPRGSRPVLMTVLLSTLLALVIGVAAAPSQARPAEEPFRTSYQPATPSIAGDQPPYVTPTVRSGWDHVATAEEKYLASYGSPKPVASGPATASSDDTPWLLIGLASGATLLLLAVAGSQLSRRQTRHHRVEIPA